jgi:hypothetical protein
MGRRKRSGGAQGPEGAATWDRNASRDWAVDEWNNGQQWHWSVRKQPVDENEDPVLKTSNEPNDSERQSVCKQELRSVVQGNARLQKQCHDEKMRADALKAEVKASMATIRSLQQSHQSMEKTIADLQAENARLRHSVGSLTDKVVEVETDKDALWKSYFAFRYFHRFKLAAKGSSRPTNGGGLAGFCAPMEYTTRDEDGKTPD